MQMESLDFAEGTENGKRWISGHVPVGKNKNVYIDTRNGEGIAEVIQVLHKFVSYQASKVNFPSYSKEDIVQEMKLLALEAIPRYDITKQANIITFLQNHIRNRIINLCKFVSEKRRRATYYNTDQCKIKCPDCKSFTKIYKESETFACHFCHRTAPKTDPGWKKYNMPIVAIGFGAIEAMIDDNGNNGTSMAEIFSDSNTDLAFVKAINMPLEDKIQKRVDFMRIYEQLDETNKSIIRMVIEGHTYKHIAQEVGLSEKAAYARASKIMKGKKRQ